MKNQFYVHKTKKEKKILQYSTQYELLNALKSKISIVAYIYIQYVLSI